MVLPMDPEHIQAGLARFAADLTVAGEPIAFDVVVARHLEFLIKLRATGLRWPSLARMLAAAGAQRPDGSPFSADQIRASVSRVRQRLITAPAPRVAASTGVDHDSRIARVPAHSMLQRPSGPAPSNRPQSSDPDLALPDLSDAEILAARQRLLGA